MKLCGPPGTLPSHPCMNVSQFKTKMWTGWNAKPATLHYRGDFFSPSFWISLVFSCEPSRAFWLWALTVSLPVCFSVSISQSHASKAQMQIYDLEARKRLQRWTCALTETWVSDSLIKRDVALEGHFHHSLMSNRLFCWLSPPSPGITNLRLGSKQRSCYPKSSAFPRHRQTFPLTLQQELFHLYIFLSNYFSSHVCSSLTLCFQCASFLHPLP